jgi:two-component system, OmpR family, sensor kinase
MVAAADNLMREISLGGRNAAATRSLAEETSMAVVRDGRRASRIVGDLTLAAQLDVAELAQHEVLPVRMDASELLQSTVANAQLHSEFSIQLTNTAGPTWVHADPDRLQQIINNLLSNANRWAETKILVSAERAGNSWVVRVTDDGPGVPADQRENIFGRFVRLDTNRARSRGGSGLGLAISQALATAQQGSLRCLENDSVTGGAVFELRLPIAK